MSKFISVIIPTYNRSHLLINCLKSLEMQLLDKDKFEVIVVNDGSSDDTQGVADNIASRGAINLKLVSQDNKGVSFARNRGIREADGELIAFTDDDCILPPYWLEMLVQSWKECDDYVAGIGGPLDTVTSDPNLFVSQYLAYIDEFNHVPVLKAGFIRPVHVSKFLGNEVVPYLRTSNASFRKICLLEIGGFDPVFCRPGGEDPDLCYRLLAKGYKFRFEPSLMVGHNSRESMRSYFNSLGNYVRGEFIKSVKIKKYPDIIRRSYRFILLQKMASLLISIIILPLCLAKNAINSKGRFVFRILFPFVDIASKMYAASIAFRLSTEKLHRIVFSDAR